MDIDEIRKALVEGWEEIEATTGVPAQPAAVENESGPVGLKVVDGLYAMSKKSEVANIYAIVTPKKGEVFAGVTDGNVTSISTIDDSVCSSFKLAEVSIYLPDGKLDTGFVPILERTNTPGVFKAYNICHAGTKWKYVRIDPVIWAKAMKYRSMYLASLNALFASIDIDKPYSES